MKLLVLWWFIELYSWFFLRASQQTKKGVQGRSASSPPASARWSPPRPPCGRQAAWRWGSQGRRGRPAKPSTPVSAASLSTWEDRNISSVFPVYFQCVCNCVCSVCTVRFSFNRKFPPDPAFKDVAWVATTLKRYHIKTEICVFKELFWLWATIKDILRMNVWSPCCLGMLIWKQNRWTPLDLASKLQNVFVWNAKCICLNCQMYLFELPNVFVQIDKYISSNWRKKVWKFNLKAERVAGLSPKRTNNKRFTLWKFLKLNKLGRKSMFGWQIWKNCLTQWL